MSSGEVWVIRAGRGGQYAATFEREGIVAVDVDGVPNVSGLSRQEIAERAIARHNTNEARSTGHATMLYRFANELQQGDLVLTPDPEDATVLVGRIIGKYEYRDEIATSGNQHVRRVEWLGRIARAKLSQQARQAIGAPMAVFKPGAQDVVAQEVGKII